MCDLAHHSAIRATADSQPGAYGKLWLMHNLRRKKENMICTVEDNGGDMREETGK